MKQVTRYWVIRADDGLYCHAEAHWGPLAGALRFGGDGFEDAKPFFDTAGEEWVEVDADGQLIDVNKPVRKWAVAKLPAGSPNQLFCTAASGRLSDVIGMTDSLTWTSDLREAFVCDDADLPNMLPAALRMAVAVFVHADGTVTLAEPSPAETQPGEAAPVRMWVVQSGDEYYGGSASSSASGAVCDLASASRFPCEQTLEFLPGRNVPVLVHADGTVTLDEPAPTVAQPDEETSVHKLMWVVRRHGSFIAQDDIVGWTSDLSEAKRYPERPSAFSAGTGVDILPVFVDADGTVTPREAKLAALERALDEPMHMWVVRRIPKGDFYKCTDAYEIPSWTSELASACRYTSPQLVNEAYRENVPVLVHADGTVTLAEPAPAVAPPPEAMAQPVRMWVVRVSDGYYYDCGLMGGYVQDLARAARYTCEQTLVCLPGRNVPILVHADGTVTLDESAPATAQSVDTPAPVRKWVVRDSDGLFFTGGSLPRWSPRLADARLMMYQKRMVFVDPLDPLRHSLQVMVPVLVHPDGTVTLDEPAHDVAQPVEAAKPVRMWVSKRVSDGLYYTTGAGTWGASVLAAYRWALPPNAAGATKVNVPVLVHPDGMVTLDEPAPAVAQPSPYSDSSALAPRAVTDTVERMEKLVAKRERVNVLLAQLSRKAMKLDEKIDTAKARLRGGL